MDLPKLKLLATDMNPEHLNRARSGIYSGSSLKELSPESQSLYFKKIAGKNLYAVKALLGQGVVWQLHHLLSDPPDSNFNIIFLRNNVLTYYKDQLKKEAFKKVLESLAPSGLLIIGSHEALPYETTDLVTVSSHPFVFRKPDLRL
jgi:chemotaxis methyl-accepting protein methylase